MGQREKRYHGEMCWRDKLGGIGIKRFRGWGEFGEMTTILGHLTRIVLFRTQLKNLMLA